MSGTRPYSVSQPSLFGALLPVRTWLRSPALRSWPLLIFVVLVAVPPAGLVIIGPNPTMMSFRDASWLFATYFAVAWLLLIGVIVRPGQVTRQLLFLVVVIALATQVPLALALEKALHASSSNLLSSIFTIGLPEELAKAIPVVVVAALFRNRLSPVGYLFLGAVSGLAFGASEVVSYITAGAGVGQESTEILILSYVWRFVTDPITHACWAGLTGYFIGLAVTGRYKWHQVSWVGLAMAMVLHGLNDWNTINGHVSWIVIVAVSGILFVAYAKAGPAAAIEPATSNYPDPARPGPHATASPAVPVVPTVPAAPAVPAVSATDGNWYAARAGAREGWWQSFAPAAQPAMEPGTPRQATARKKAWWEE